MSEPVKTLVLCSNPEDSRILASVLAPCGLVPLSCFNLSEGRTLLAREDIRLVFSEDRLVDAGFRDVLEAIGNLRPGTPLIVFSRLGIWDYYLEVTQSGAFECVTFPFLPRDVKSIIHDALMGSGQHQQHARAIAAKNLPTN